jgi:hypothetical protein
MCTVHYEADRPPYWFAHPERFGTRHDGIVIILICAILELAIYFVCIFVQIFQKERFI